MYMLAWDVGGVVGILQCLGECGVAFSLILGPLSLLAGVTSGLEDAS